MAKFEVNGQIFKFLKTANGHGHSPNRQNSNRRMASQNFIFSKPQRLLRADPDPISNRPEAQFQKFPNPNFELTLAITRNRPCLTIRNLRIVESGEWPNSKVGPPLQIWPFAYFSHSLVRTGYVTNIFNLSSTYFVSNIRLPDRHQL